MKTQWSIQVPIEEKERIALTYGDPANALTAANDYALYHIPKAISNWHAIVPLLQPNHLYDVTAFYSKRKTDISKENENLLITYNQKAFDAAKIKGGLILYYQGVLLENANTLIDKELELPFVPNCLSFCIWNTIEEAKAGAQISEHKQAALMMSLWYENFAILKYQLRLDIKGLKKTLIFNYVPNLSKSTIHMIKYNNL